MNSARAEKLVSPYPAARPRCILFLAKYRTFEMNHQHESRRSLVCDAISGPGTRQCSPILPFGRL